ncbi:unnamed protein product, partial [Pylaiella littoralis]
ICFIGPQGQSSSVRARASPWVTFTNQFQNQVNASPKKWRLLYLVLTNKNQAVSGRQKFSYWGSRNRDAYIRCRLCTNNSPHMRPRSYTRENGERNIPDQGVSGEPQSSRWRSSCTRAAQVCGR